jgi:hypothetical protein
MCLPIVNHGKVQSALVLGERMSTLDRPNGEGVHILKNKLEV